MVAGIVARMIQNSALAGIAGQLDHHPDHECDRLMPGQHGHHHRRRGLAALALQRASGQGTFPVIEFGAERRREIQRQATITVPVGTVVSSRQRRSASPVGTTGAVTSLATPTVLAYDASDGGLVTSFGHPSPGNPDLANCHAALRPDRRDDSAHCHRANRVRGDGR